MGYFEKLKEVEKWNKTSLNLTPILTKFYESYKRAAESNGISSSLIESHLFQLLDLIIEEIKNPYKFEPFHEALKDPIDYYRFGLEFIKPLVIEKESKILNTKYLDDIEHHLSKGENVILFANHQTEPDPQAISILIEKKHPKLAEEMIFVAGHRVISDPLCIPFSKGRNLLCIFSKKYIKEPLEKMREKQLHNKRTMAQMKELLSEGGKCIYVAPSGGRDRMNAKGIIEVAKFDPQSIELFSLIAGQVDKKTRFYPLALSTYDLLPPPLSVEHELGEERMAKSTPIHLCFNKEIEMDLFLNDEKLDKKGKKEARADYIWNIVKADYEKIASK